MKRLLTESEKIQVRKQQEDGDGVLKCFISGQIIGPKDEIEYDHLHAYSKDGETMSVVISFGATGYQATNLDDSSSYGSM